MLSLSTFAHDSGTINFNVASPSPSREKAVPFGKAASNKIGPPPPSDTDARRLTWSHSNPVRRLCREVKPNRPSATQQGRQRPASAAPSRPIGQLLRTRQRGNRQR